MAAVMAPARSKLCRESARQSDPGTSHRAPRSITAAIRTGANNTQRHDWRSIVDEASRAAATDAAQRLVNLVGAVATRAAEDGFRGCTLRNAYAEFPDEAHPAHQVITAHYIERQDLLRDLAERARARDPDGLADRVALIIDGINANGAVLGSAGTIRAAVAFAEDTIRVHTQAA